MVHWYTHAHTHTHGWIMRNGVQDCRCFLNHNQSSEHSCMFSVGIVEVLIVCQNIRLINFSVLGRMGTVCSKFFLSATPSALPQSPYLSAVRQHGVFVSEDIPWSARSGIEGAQPQILEEVWKHHLIFNQSSFSLICFIYYTCL